MGVPRSLLDATSEIDFARSISAQNANFLRDVIRYQKDFADSFTQLVQALYRNEFSFSENEKVDLDTMIAVENISVYFNSPAALNMTNLSEQITVADQNADFIANQYVILNQDGSNEELRQKMKTRIIKKLLPAVEWEEYDKIYNELLIDFEGEKIDKDITALKTPSQDDFNEQPY